MKKIIESLCTPITENCDVLIAGGGVAGIAAALASARQGAKTVLVERGYMLGGLATAGLVTIYLPLCNGRGKQVSFGIAEELLKTAILHGCEKDYPKAWLENGTLEEKKEKRFQVQYNAQLFALEAEKLLKQENVTIYYGTSVSNVYVANKKITHVIVENKSGRTAFQVRSVVDATGDADLCKMADEDTELFSQKNVLAAWYYHTGEAGYNLRMLGVADIPEEDKVEESPLLLPRRFQGIDGKELSEIMQLAHEVILQDVLEHKKTEKNYFPTTIATIPQVRMTRRLKGCYEMKTLDEKKSFTDSIGMIGNWKKKGPIYEIPFDALHGNKVHNLITAGRCISAEDAMWDVTRVIPACAVTGEAAGTAAAISNNFNELDITILQEKLRKNGCKIFYNELDL